MSSVTCVITCAIRLPGCLTRLTAIQLSRLRFSCSNIKDEQSNKAFLAMRNIYIQIYSSNFLPDTQRLSTSTKVAERISCKQPKHEEIESVSNWSNSLCRQKCRHKLECWFGGYRACHSELEAVVFFFVHSVILRYLQFCFSSWSGREKFEDFTLTFKVAHREGKVFVVCFMLVVVCA